MVDELFDRVASVIRHYTDPEDAARAVLAELAGELRDAERWHHFREFFGLVDPDDELIIWRRKDIDNCVDKYIDEARGE